MFKAILARNCRHAEIGIALFRDSEPSTLPADDALRLLPSLQYIAFPSEFDYGGAAG